MSDGAGRGLIERARDAAALNDWRQAFDLLMEADADGRLAPTDLPVLGEVAYAAGQLDVTIEAWERAERLDPFYPATALALRARAYTMLGEFEPRRGLEA